MTHLCPSVPQLVVLRVHGVRGDRQEGVRAVAGAEGLRGADQVGGHHPAHYQKIYVDQKNASKCRRAAVSSKIKIHGRYLQWMLTAPAVFLASTKILLAALAAFLAA